MVSQNKILLVEDDQNIAEGIVAMLAGEGMDVELVTSVAAAKAVKSSWDLCLLDWMLPDGQGIHLLQHWRQTNCRRPVIMLTARTDVIDKVLGLEIGADDYVTKPFEPRELIARIHARLREKSAPASDVEAQVVSGDLTIDRKTMEVTLGDQPIALTKMEFELLIFLVENAGSVYTRDELLDAVWGYENYPSTRTVDTHILQLRQKLRADFFETVRSVGYRFVKSG